MANTTLTPNAASLVLKTYAPDVSAHGYKPAEFSLGAIMDAIADKLLDDGVTQTAYAYPVSQMQVPCAVVGYPTKIDFDMTFKRGADRIEFPLWFVVGKVVDRAARDQLSKTITGAVGIKQSLDSNLHGAISSGHCVDCVVETITVADIEYLTAKFLYEVIT